MTQPATDTQTAADWIPDDATFGARLALVRQRMGWNISEAARECGLHGESWRLWEQQGRTPSRLITIAMAIHSRTGCDYLWLVHGPGRGGAKLTLGYPRDLADLVNPPTPPALRPRVVLPAQRVVHGDGRRRSRGGTTIPARKSNGPDHPRTLDRVATGDSLKGDSIHASR